jgi:DNA-directed RNA polymerase specialized sigma24 family protein
MVCQYFLSEVGLDNFFLSLFTVQQIRKDLIVPGSTGNDGGQHLINAVIQGSPEAFARLYDQYSAILFGFISRIVDHPHIAEGVLQNSFIVIWKSMATYNPEKERILTWMLKITMNVAISALPETAEDNKEAITEPLDIKTLNTVITLIFFKGLSLGDVAKKLEIPLNLLIPKMKLAFKQLHGGQAQ